MTAINTHYIVTIQQAADPSTKGSQGITVSAPMPAQFSFDTRAEYQAPYAQGLFGNGALSQIAKLGGIRLTSQALTAQIWQGSSETELGLELEFHAESDPDLEVRQPILALMKLATASIENGLLKSPGPQLSLDLLQQIATSAITDTVSSAGAVVGALGSVATGNVKQGNLNTPNSNLNGQNNSNTPPATNNGLGGAQFWKNNVKNQISIQIGNYAFFDSVVITNVQKTYEHQIDFVTGLPMYAKVAIQFKPLFLLVQTDLDQIFSIPGTSQAYTKS